MDFDLTEEQVAIRELALSFAERELAPFAVEWDQKKEFPVDVLRKAGALGMGGMTVAPDLGGSGLSRLDCTIIIEALARGCPSIASYVSIHNMCAALVDRFATEGQRREWLPGLVTMERLASYCLTEPDCGSDAAALRTQAVRDGDGYRLNGQKQFISGAGTSDVYIVMARTGGTGAKGISAFLVPRDTLGLSFGANEQKMGWNAQPTRAVMFDDVLIPASARLGGDGEGFRIAMTGLDGGRLNIAASSLGGAQAAFDRAVSYMSERKAFGKTLTQFQALQFALSEMAIDLEASRTFLWRAASAYDRGAAETTLLCAMAKKFVTDRSFEVANRALQLHGGYGYLAEFVVEKIVRDLRVHQILEGTNEIMQLIIARSVTGITEEEKQ